MKSLNEMSKREFLKDCAKNDVNSEVCEDIKQQLENLFDCSINTLAMIDRLPESVIANMYDDTILIMKESLDRLKGFNGVHLTEKQTIALFDIEFRL